MRIKDIKPGLIVWVPWHTFKRATIVRQEGQYRTIVQTDEGKELIASTRALEAYTQE